MLEVHSVVVAPTTKPKIFVKPLPDHPLLDTKHLWKIRLVPVNPGEPVCFEVYVDTAEPERVKQADNELFVVVLRYLKAFDPLRSVIESNLNRS